MNMRFRALSVAVPVLAGLIACTPSESDAPAVDIAAARAEVDAAMTGMLEAYATNDVEAYFGFFANDATLMTNGGSIQPVAEYRENWSRLIGGGGGVAAVDTDAPRTVRMMPDGTTAVVLTAAIPASYRYLDSENQGEFVIADNVWSESITWSRVDGAWKIMHFHYHDARD